MSSYELWQSQREMIIPEAAIEAVEKIVAEIMRVKLEHVTLGPLGEVLKSTDDVVSSRRLVTCPQWDYPSPPDRSRCKITPQIYCYFIFYINMLIIYNYITY